MTSTDDFVDPSLNTFIRFTIWLCSFRKFFHLLLDVSACLGLSASDKSRQVDSFRRLKFTIATCPQANMFTYLYNERGLNYKRTTLTQKYKLRYLYSRFVPENYLSFYNPFSVLSRNPFWSGSGEGRLIIDCFKGLNEEKWRSLRLWSRFR